MFRSCILLVGIVSSLAACKQRTQPDSALRDIEDTDEIRRIDGEDRYFVVCREGRLHQGKRTVTVTKAELRTVCEQNASTGGGTPPPPTGGGGVPQDLSACPTLPERVKNINVAFSPGYSQTLAGQPAAVAKQQVCGGLVSNLNSLLTSSQSLHRFLTGNGGQQQSVLLVVETKDQPVRYDASSLILNMPARFDEQLMVQIEAALAAQNVSFCPPTTRRVLGACWVKGGPGQSCDEACAAVQAAGDPLTITVAGSGGTLDGCKAVALAFGHGTAIDANDCGLATAGCHDRGNPEIARCTNGTTDLASKEGSRKRFCACRPL